MQIYGVEVKRGGIPWGYTKIPCQGKIIAKVPSSNGAKGNDWAKFINHSNIWSTIHNIHGNGVSVLHTEKYIKKWASRLALWSK